MHTNEIPRSKIYHCRIFRDCASYDDGNGIDLYKEKYMDHKKMTVTETPEELEEQEEMDI